MDSLDKDLIEALLLAKEFGFSVSVLPVEILLETAIDLCLQIGEKLQEGASGQKIGQDLKFLDLAKADALGNSRSIKVGPKTKPDYFDPKAGNFVRNYLAEFFVQLKRHVPFGEAFLELSRKDVPLPPELDAQGTKTLDKKNSSNKMVETKRFHHREAQRAQARRGFSRRRRKC